jgi:formylmethanofuran dehydrogenase subunit C
MVEGSVGHFCGAGMLDGEISVKGKSGLSTGQFMHGGRIDVDGIVEGMGDPVFGGSIYQEGQRLFSPEQLS